MRVGDNVRLSHSMLQVVFWRLDVGGLARESRQWTCGGTVSVSVLVLRGSIQGQTYVSGLELAALGLASD